MRSHSFYSLIQSLSTFGNSGFPHLARDVTVPTGYSCSPPQAWQSVFSQSSRGISCWCWESSRGGDPVLSLSACSNSYSCQVHISTLLFPTQIFHLEHPASVTHPTFLRPELNEPFTNWYFLPLQVTIKQCFNFISSSLNIPKPLKLPHFSISSTYYIPFFECFLCFQQPFCILYKAPALGCSMSLPKSTLRDWKDSRRSWLRWLPPS